MGPIFEKSLKDLAKVENIQMVDLKNQYLRIKNEIDQEISEVLNSTRFIGGPKVEEFEKALSNFLDTGYVISCANGTDALQIALMALDLQPGDEVIVPAFTYVATAEVIALLRLKPVMVDVELDTFNTTKDLVSKVISEKTKAIIPVHLFGQCSDMAGLIELGKEFGIPVIEDNAQAIGSEYTSPDGTKSMAGTIGDMGTTSFFPSKNLGCYGDGGALMTNDESLANKISMIKNHGQVKKYYHEIIGVNSRLDAIQAAILNVKLKYIDKYQAQRNQVADRYDEPLARLDQLTIPSRAPYSTHVFHQYTIRIHNGQRDALKRFLNEKNIPCNIYYPVPLYSQNAFKDLCTQQDLENTETLCESVLSLPIHTEMKKETQDYIIDSIIQFFN